MLEERIGKRIAAIGSHKNAHIPAKKSGHTGINVVPNNTVWLPAWANDPRFDSYAYQIYGKKNHMALDCFHRYDYNYQKRHPPKQLAAMVAHYNSLYNDHTRYVDNGTNQNVILDIGNLHLIEPYQGDDKIVVENGNG